MPDVRARVIDVYVYPAYPGIPSGAVVVPLNTRDPIWTDPKIRRNSGNAYTLAYVFTSAAYRRVCIPVCSSLYVRRVLQRLAAFNSGQSLPASFIGIAETMWPP